MCQVHEEDFIQAITKESVQNKSCNKCEEPAIILVGTNGKFCRECFIVYLTHKFRAALGKHGNVRYGDRVAVAYSGGPNSSTMLHVLLKELAPENPKKLKFKPGIIFVDESIILKEDVEQKVKKVKAVIEASGLPYNIINISEVMSGGTTSISEVFNVLSTLTAKEEMVHKLRCRLIANKAQSLGYQHVFLAETTTRLAINILTNVAQGKGAHIAKDTAFCDSGRFKGINILRPMRDISAKEVAVYNAINKVEVVVFPTFGTRTNAKASIRRLTEEFVLGLSQNFPATETTVYRTANKIKCHLANDTMCALCGGMLDTKINVLSTTARDALNFTEKLSNGELGSSFSPSELVVVNPTTADDSVDILTSTLCHACSILKTEYSITQNSENYSTIFERTLQPEGHILSTEEMENKLSDCLLLE